MTLGWHLAKEIKGNESDFVNQKKVCGKIKNYSYLFGNVSSRLDIYGQYKDLQITLDSCGHVLQDKN